MSSQTPTPTPHNTANQGDIAGMMLMPGDPLRAKYIADRFLQDVVCFNQVRNMLGFTGTYHGKRVSVMGSGMGIPSISLYTYELYHFYHVEGVIRVGTAGGIGENIRLRDVIVAMSAATDSNFAAQFDFPGTLAPTADYPLLRKAVEAAEAKGIETVVGSVLSSDIFYYAQDGFIPKFQRMGILGLEMETAGLYLTAAFAKKKALSILTVSDHLLTGEALSTQERQESLDDMIEVALETAAQFA
ncbi:MAG: purine-nucleoside phosphorylase [Clostridiales bacterium]|nr:purine-nucleoside phosphorylase [Clostridiales bacterium]